MILPVSFISGGEYGIMDLDYQEIGRNIRRFRQAKGLKQKELAELIQVSDQHVSHIENAHTQVSLPTLVLIANAIGVSVDELLCDSVEKSKHVFDDALSRIAKDCDDWETRIIADVAAALKESLRKTVR